MNSDTYRKASKIVKKNWKLRCCLDRFNSHRDIEYIEDLSHENQNKIFKFIADLASEEIIELEKEFEAL